MATKLRKVRKTRKRSCKNGKLKRPIRTKKGGKRRCKKSRRKSKKTSKRSRKKKSFRMRRWIVDRWSKSRQRYHSIRHFERQLRLFYTLKKAAGFSGDTKQMLMKKVKKLLDAGAEPNEQLVSPLGYSPKSTSVHRWFELQYISKFYGWTPFNFAINEEGSYQKLDTEIVRMLLNAGADVNAKNDDGKTALMIASMKGHTEVVKMLIERGADVNAKNDDGKTALMYWHVYIGNIEVVVRMLLDAGADVNMTDRYGNTALMIASGTRYSGRIEIVRMLIEHGADVNKKNVNNKRAIDLARDDYNTEIINFLTQYDKNDKTALIKASSRGRTEVVRMLLDAGANSNLRNRDGKTALMEASNNGHTEIVRMLLNAGADVNMTDNYGAPALMKASNWGHTEIVRMLLERGADVNMKTDRTTALMEAINNGHTKVLRMLLDEGAAVNMKTEKGYTALLKASIIGNTEIVRILIERGADVNITDRDGAPALMGASYIGHTEIVRILIDNGANAYVNAKGWRGTTALMGASEGEGIAHVPIGKISSDKIDYTKVVRMLLNAGADVNAENDDGQTPLILASEKGSTEVVKMLLDAGADVNAKLLYYLTYNIFGYFINRYTPLMGASKKGHVEVVKMLIERGADVNAINEYGNTSLHYASNNGHTEVVKMLIEHGADMNAKNNDGDTALMLASNEGHTEVVKFLRQYDERVVDGDEFFDAVNYTGPCPARTHTLELCNDLGNSESDKKKKKKIFLNQVRKVHPDKNSGCTDLAEREFKKLQESCDPQN